MNVSLPYYAVGLNVFGKLEPQLHTLHLTPYMMAVLKYENPSWNYVGWPPSLVNKQTKAAGPAQVKPGILMDLGILHLEPEAAEAVRKYERTRKYTRLYDQVLATTLAKRKSTATAAQYLIRSEEVYAKRLRKLGLPVTVANMLNLHAYGMYSRPKEDSQATKVANAVVGELNGANLRHGVNAVKKYAQAADEVVKAVAKPYASAKSML